MAYVDAVGNEVGEFKGKAFFGTARAAIDRLDASIFQDAVLMFKVALASLLLTCTFCAHAGTTVDVSKIYGKIQFVDSYPDYKVKVVNQFPDLKVKKVDSWPDSVGKWQTVDSYPDYKIQIVDSYPDFTIEYVESWPGVN